MTDLYLLTEPAGGSSPVAGMMTEAAAAFHRGDLNAANELCRKVNERAPDHAEAFNLAAAIAVMAGQPDRAELLLRQAVTLADWVREYRHNLGNVQHLLGWIEPAIESFTAALRLAPLAVDSLYELALCLAESGQQAAARQAFTGVIALVPEIAEAYHQLGILKLQAEENHAARLDFGRAILCRPDFTDAYTNLAILQRDAEQLDQALCNFRRAVALRPDDAFTHCNLGTLQKELGRSDHYTRALEHAVALAPFEAEFHYSLAISRSFTPGDGRLEALERLAAKLPSLDRSARINLHFALAKAYEDLGDAERSFDHQLRGNSLKRSEMEYDEAAMMRGFARIKSVFTADFLRQGAGQGDPSTVPIFVLGMPRSGSTLIEQILASHKMVFGAGELPDLPLLARQLGSGEGPFFPEIVATLSDADFRRLGSEYVKGLTARAPEAPRVVDKLPENFRLIGLIHRALPQARIIHTRRDPVDSCLSIYSKLFTAAVPFSYDLAEIGRYWRAYEDLMQHWRDVLPEGTMLEMEYESLVADQEGETRRLLDFCGLPWDDSCLSFHTTERQIRTASSLQVRQPIYQSSVGRWRPDAARLAPLMQGLQAHLS